MKKKFKINWEKGSGLIPAIIQHADDGRVLMLGFMNPESLAQTLKTKKAWFYSRTKKRLWMKGEVSGRVLRVTDIKLDCDGDTLLIKAQPNGPTCHTGAETCFNEPAENQNMLAELFRVIEERKKEMPAGSYTGFLFSKGLDKICAKVEEESDEVIHAAKHETQKRLIEESVDLLYHLFVLLVQKKIPLRAVLDEARKRRIPRLR